MGTSKSLPIYQYSIPQLVVKQQMVHPTNQEVTIAIKRLKNNKSPGSDGKPLAYLKADGDVLDEHLHIVLPKVWSEQELPP